MKIRDVRRWDGHSCGCVTGWDHIADKSVARYRCPTHRQYREPEAVPGSYVDTNDVEGSLLALSDAVERISPRDR